MQGDPDGQRMDLDMEGVRGRVVMPIVCVGGDNADRVDPTRSRRRRPADLGVSSAQCRSNASPEGSVPLSVNVGVGYPLRESMAIVVAWPVVA